jgi:hypothetical protein
MTDQFPQNFGGSAVPPQNNGSASDAVNVPSILLITAGAIGILSSLFGLVSSNGAQMAEIMNNPALPPGAKDAIAQLAGGPLSKISSIIGILIQGVVIFGALQMRQLKNYGLCMASAIIAILPCFGCCCIGTPVGIFALIVLLKPEVKAAFT